MRPVIDKAKYGNEGEPRAFIDATGVQAVMQEMTDQWVITPNGHGRNLKLLLRTYVAMIASTGIRAGLEAKRIRLGDVRLAANTGDR